MDSVIVTSPLLKSARISSGVLSVIFKKVLILMMVGIANIVDIHVVGTGSALRGAVICFYLSNEGVLAS